jgi:hypothetical protein
MFGAEETARCVEWVEYLFCGFNPTAEAFTAWNVFGVSGHYRSLHVFI